MRVTWDRQAKALYVCIIKNPELDHTEEWVKDMVYVDKTILGQIAGIEILNVELEQLNG